jgi:hypothetical protein
MLVCSCILMSLVRVSHETAVDFPNLTIIFTLEVPVAACDELGQGSLSVVGNWGS